ncbi:MAG: type II secretion system protein [Candidatus Cloacimonetes bacterium]|nr:type II secretion system protein [Candidatus Cloacimonadota bacterium]
MKKKAFTLVEVMIAGMIAGTISIILMTLLTKFYKSSEQFSGKVQTAQQSNIILYHMKMALRGLASTPTIEENLLEGQDSKGNQINFDFTASENSISITYGGNNPKNFAKGKVLGFRVFSMMRPEDGVSYEGQEDAYQFNMYNIELLMDDPQSNGLSSPKTALRYYGIVTVRVPGEKVPDPSWVKNSESFPSGAGE